ncbi:hypothetical protein SAMN02910265_00024 [Ruminococcus flavefaciens]|uniref:Uncharacterized protein n=1 Tax=Ruminococcus flavefaciens TaxID=1265 RepID=A0A1H6HMF1_RUMFL|nr:hypothetical protein [Ruminococcus flavefaciens]SEH36666.1 hypothetical protein SAMN02910265_00024 [Ruminococcus flavefaciens]
MRKHCGWKKTAAFLMAAALVTGAMPVNAGGLFNGNSAIVANAASEAKKPEVGTLFKAGDTIAITGETWFVVDDDPNSGDARAKVESDIAITGYESSDTDNQYIWKTGDVELYTLHKGFYVTREDSSVDPEGFYITSGSGTYEDPFIIGLKAPKFSGKNITLDSDIGMNFIVNPVSEANIDDLKVKFSGDCDETGLQQLELKTINGKEVYCATANVATNKMDRVITADLYYGDSETPIDTLSFSVNEYLDTVDTSSSPKLKALVEATRQYGKVSTAYFGNGELPKVNDHKNDIVNAAYKFGDYTIYKFKPGFESSDAIISLVLNSKISVRLYTAKYEQSGHDVAAYDIWTFDENNKLQISPFKEIYAFDGANGKKCFEVPDIKPTQLGTTFNVNYQGTDYLFTPLAWAYRVLSHEAAPEKDIALANALYEYYIAATDYVG